MQKPAAYNHAARFVPFNGRLKIELVGELAALLILGMAPKNEHPLDNSKGVQVTVVAGAGFVQDPEIIIKKDLSSLQFGFFKTGPSKYGRVSCLGI